MLHQARPPKSIGLTPQIQEVRKRLLVYRRWSYLRYVHLREGFLLTKGVRSVLAIGCGRGLAELALALEFPDIQFHLTDIDSEATPNYQRAQELVDVWKVPNVTFGVHDIVQPLPERYDLITSVEVLEHILEDELAAKNMLNGARHYVFALVPFADRGSNEREDLRARVWSNNEHWRVGYDESRLRALFPGRATIRGCYWECGGAVLRDQLHSSSDEEILGAIKEFIDQSLTDVRMGVPAKLPEAQGIWILAEKARAPRSLLDRVGRGPVGGSRLTYSSSAGRRLLHPRRGATGVKLSRQPPLPPPALRQGGEHFLDDNAFRRSAQSDARRLVREAGLRPWSSVVDLGCGPGRLAIGLLSSFWFHGSYLGVEVQRRHVEWCSDHLTSRFPGFKFAHVDALNERYNPQGSNERRLPISDGSCDVFYAFSVFTHMRGVEVEAYLHEVRRVLAPKGRALFTSFVEQDVPDEAENPAGYGPLMWRTPLHCVRFSLERMLAMVEDAGLIVDQWHHRSDADGQSAFIIKLKDSRPHSMKGGSLCRLRAIAGQSRP